MRERERERERESERERERVRVSQSTKWPIMTLEKSIDNEVVKPSHLKRLHCNWSLLRCNSQQQLLVGLL